MALNVCVNYTELFHFIIICAEPVLHYERYVICFNMDCTLVHSVQVRLHIGATCFAQIASITDCTLVQSVLHKLHVGTICLHRLHVGEIYFGDRYILSLRYCTEMQSVQDIGTICVREIAPLCKNILQIGALSWLIASHQSCLALTIADNVLYSIIASWINKKTD